MKLKKFTAVLIIMTIMLTTITPAAAEQSYVYENQARALYDIGLFKGSSETEFVPNLGAALTRQEGVAMLIRLMGLEDDALAMSEQEVTNILNKVPDANNIALWARKYMAYGIKNELVAGMPDGSIDPLGALLGKAYCTLILRAMGYTVDADGYQVAAATLSSIGGLTIQEALKFNDKPLIRDDLVGISHSALQAKYSDGKTVMAVLVEKKAVDEDKVIDMGLYPEGKAAREERERLEKEAEERAKAEKAAKDAAEAAVKLYEDADISTLELIAQAEVLKKIAEEKVSLVVNNTDKAIFNARLTAKTTAIESRKATLQTIKNAEDALLGYKNAPADTIEQIEAAEMLEDAARQAIAKLSDGDKKTSLLNDLEAHKAILDAKREAMQKTEVASVSSETLKTITITFTKPINPNSVKDTTVTSTTHAIAYRTLSEDGKTLHIDLANAVNQGDSVKIILEGIIDQTGLPLGRYEKTIELVDTTFPVPLGVEYVSRKKIRFLFSEPVSFTTYGVYKTTNKDNLNNKVEFKIDGLYAFAKFTPDKNYLEIEFMSPIEPGYHEVILSGITDYAGLPVKETMSYSFNAIVDVVAPKAMLVEAPDTGTLIITFDEEITVDGNPVVKVTEIGGDEVTINKSAMSVVNKTQLKISLSRRLTAASLIGFTVVVKDVEDTSGNKCIETSLSGVIADDTTPPKLLSYKVLENNNVQIVFNKEVDITSGKATIIDSKGNRTQKTISVGSDMDVEYDYVVITGLTSSNIADYILELEGITDKSIRRNPIDKIQIPFRTYDTIAPTIEFAVHKSENRIEITFSEPMMASTINNITSYFLRYGTELISLHDKGATVESISSDNRKVTLKIPKEINYDAIILLGAKDANGKDLTGPGSIFTMPKFISSTYDPVTISDLVYEVIEPRTIKLTFGKDASGNDLKPGYTFTDANISAFKFQLTNGESFDMGVIGAMITDNGRSIHVLTSVPFNSDCTVSKDENTRLGVFMWLAPGVKDMNDKDVIITGKKLVTDKLNAEQISTARDTNNSGRIILTFSEDVKYADALGSSSADSIMASGIDVKDSNGNTLVPIVDYTVSLSGRYLTITVSSSKKGDMSVTLIRPEFLTDNAGNAVVPLGTQVVRDVNE
ncbi:MAG TPA: Ig-like domain-containing protein [Clostridiaceae bacterium]|nr:Ig-like domain-containing protein [Clostridiaceae bacterium]